MTIETSVAIIEKVRGSRYGSFHLGLSEFDSVTDKKTGLEFIWETYQTEHNHDDYVAVIEINTATGESKTLANRAEIMRYIDDKEDKESDLERSEMSEGEKADQREIDRHNFSTGSTL